MTSAECSCFSFQIHFYTRHLSLDEMKRYSDICEDLCWDIFSSWKIENPGSVHFMPNCKLFNVCMVCRTFINVVHLLIIHRLELWLHGKWEDNPSKYLSGDLSRRISYIIIGETDLITILKYWNIKLNWNLRKKSLNFSHKFNVTRSVD